jgi:hypothetical protein
MKRLTITLGDIPPDAAEGLVVSFREAVYYSRRLQLLLRGVGFHRASSRARLLAYYLERRRGRIGARQ